MREGWRETTLGELIQQRRDFTPVDPQAEYVILGVQRSGWGFVEREPLRGSDQKFTKLLRIDEDDLVYRTITAFEAPSAVATADQVGRFVTPQTFPVFKIDRAWMLPAFMALLTTWPAFHEEMASRCTGSVLRRKTLSVGAFRSIPVALPPLREQERIVDLIGSLDDAIAKAEVGMSASLEAIGPVIASGWSQDADWPVRKLGEVGTFTRGRRFTKADYVDQGLGCIHYGHIHTVLGPVTNEVPAHIPVSMAPRMRLASPGDVVIAATSEDVEGLGKATVWLGNQDVAVHDDCQIFRHSLDPIFAGAIFSSPQFQSNKLQFAAGMKVTRITGESLARIEVPIPPPDVQASLGAALQAFHSETIARQHEVRRLSGLRANLLTALLSGEHEIPESYDEFLEEAR